jgi:hypothetical protein
MVVPASICCVKYPVEALLLHLKKAIMIQKHLERPPASSEYKNKKLHTNGCVIYD